MSQFSLFGDEAAAPRRPATPSTAGPNGLFFALYAPPAHAESIARRTRAFVRDAGLHVNAFVDADRLHVTLLDLGTHGELPGELVASAREAAGRVAVAPFEMVFDRLAGFGPGGTALALQGRAAPQPVDGLYRALGEAMTQAGVPWFKRFHAHMTLAYLKAGFVARGTDPVCWPAAAFALVFSHRGRHRHEILGRWSLEG